MQKIFPFLWFDNQAEEAAKFYTSIFKNSRIHSITRYGEDVPGPKGKVEAVSFTLDGHEYMAFNGGPMFKFNPSISIYVNCDTQAEIDRVWEKLLEGGQVSQCGWLTDRYGLSWQVVPAILGEWMQNGEEKKVASMTKAMLKMVKLDIAELKRAYEAG